MAEYLHRDDTSEDDVLRAGAVCSPAIAFGPGDLTSTSGEADDSFDVGSLRSNGGEERPGD